MYRSKWSHLELKGREKERWHSCNPLQGHALEDKPHLEGLTLLKVPIAPLKTTTLGIKSLHMELWEILNI
jgi:hypothetical protein